MSIESFAQKNNFKIIKKIAKGWTSFIYLVENSEGNKFVLKVLREKANRRDMVKRESENLKLANSVGVGPKFVMADFDENIVVYEYVEGIVFSKWIFSNPSSAELEVFLRVVFSQAKKLDKLGLDHGQLAGKGKNIIVSNGLPVIIDFEKASTNRKVGNVNQLLSFIFINPNSSVVKTVKQILGTLVFEKLKKIKQVN